MTTVNIRNEQFQLLPERVVFHEKSRTILAADLHWGKAEVFQRSGIAVSSRVLNEDLERLSRAIEATKAERLIILGDLIHAPKGLTEHVIATVSEWRHRHPTLRIELIRGNHDRKLVMPEEWRIELHDQPIAEPPFLYAHEPPEEVTDLYVWSGHIHPMMRLRGRHDSLRLPCFAISQSHSVLPAFSEFTGGIDLRLNDWKKVFVIADNAVIEV